MITEKRHMPFAAYAALPSVNISALLELRKSAKHFRHAIDNPRKDTKTYRQGRAFHTATLEPEQFLLEYAVLKKWENFKTKAAQDWRDEQEAEGLTVLTREQYDTAWNMARAVQKDPVAGPLLVGGRHECTIQWQCPRTGIDCKGRLDYVSVAQSDLKSTRHSIPWAFGRAAARFDYHTRSAWYQDGLRIATGEDLPVKIVTCESLPPHDVCVYTMTEEQLAAGRLIYEPLMDELRLCMESGLWLGAAQGCELTLQLPAWAMEGQAASENDLLGMDLDLGEKDSDAQHEPWGDDIGLPWDVSVEESAP